MVPRKPNAGAQIVLGEEQLCICPTTAYSLLLLSELLLLAGREVMTRRSPGPGGTFAGVIWVLALPELHGDFAAGE